MKELYEEILEELAALVIEKLDPADLVDKASYRALERIKAIVQDDGLDDPACFHKIEQIICALEAVGSGGASRHDF